MNVPLNAVDEWTLIFAKTVNPLIPYPNFRAPETVYLCACLFAVSLRAASILQLDLAMYIPYIYGQHYHLFRASLTYRITLYNI